MVLSSIPNHFHDALVTASGLLFVFALLLIGVLIHSHFTRGS